MRSEFTKATKLEAWTRSGGRCQGCTAKLFPGHIEYHHGTECTFGGGNGLGNCIVLCTSCHSAITRKRASDIAKSNRVRAAHLGIKRAKKSIPGRKFDGTPIPARWMQIIDERVNEQVRARMPKQSFDKQRRGGCG